MFRTLVVSMVLMSGSAVAQPPSADVAAITGKGCVNAAPSEAVDDPGRARMQRLDQLPPASEILTVIHSVDGCQRPVIVRENIGGNPRLSGEDKAGG